MTSPTSSDDPGRELRTLVEAGRFREALEALRRIEDPAVRAQPEVELFAATASTRLGEFTQATSLAESALQRFRARGDSDGRMRAVNLLGAIAWEHGRLDDAERCFAEALELARTLNDTQMAAHASNNLASVAHLRNRADAALSLYRSALLAYQRLGDRRGTAQTYHNLGLVFREVADWEEAESAALQAVRHAEQVGEGSLVALTVMGRGEIHLDRGQFDLARREITRAADLARSAKDEVGLVEVGRLEANLALHQGQPAAALERAQAARFEAVKLGVLQIQAECTAIEALALRQLGREVDAEVRRAEARAMFERLGAEALATRLDDKWGSEPH